MYGWPKERPIEPGKRQFYMMLPSWILDDEKQLDLPQLDGILINAEDVQWVEFIHKEGGKMTNEIFKGGSNPPPPKPLTLTW